MTEQTSSPFVQVLATGGTIAGVAGSAIRRDYRSGQVGIGELLDEVAALGLPAELRGEQVANIDSSDVGQALWRDLHRRVEAALANPDCNGIIVTHGTDTAEETAFLLDLTLPTPKPIVMVGAMRAADAVGSDGLRNMANAVRVASDPASAGRGVLLVMGDRIFAARDVRKAHTQGVDAFRGYPRGPAGHVTPASLDWFSPPWRAGEPARHAFYETLPPVGIIHAYAGMPDDTVDQALAGRARGLVFAGFGQGNAPVGIRRKLGDAAAAGVLVVRSSRVDEGLVDREPDDDRHGLIAGRALGPAKARILLQVLLADGVTDWRIAQTEFDRR